MQTSLQKVATKAKEDQKYRFGSLYEMVNYDSLMLAWKSINKNAAAGVDKVTAREFSENLEQNVLEIVEALKSKRYHAKLVRRVNIDKGNGKTRPLGIPALQDKLVQKAVANILNALYEPIFDENSYGYRPNIGPQKAVADITKEINFGRYSYIVEADIKGFFDNIDHNWLVRMLELRIADKQFIRLIKKWLKAGIMETDGKVIHPVTGTPQGGIVSPVLANVYLHYALDLWFREIVKRRCEGEAYLCRFADDFICAFRYKSDAVKLYNELPGRLGKFQLTLSEEKTNIISFSKFRQYENTCFEFLGFEFRWGKSRSGDNLIRRRTSRSKLTKSVKAFSKWCKDSRNCRLWQIFAKLNAKLRGYYNYYGVIGNSQSLEQFYDQAKKILYKWLNRRSQRKSFNWDEFRKVLQRYGIEKPRITEKVNRQLKFDFA